MYPVWCGVSQGSYFGLLLYSSFSRIFLLWEARLVMVQLYRCHQCGGVKSSPSKWNYTYSRLGRKKLFKFKCINNKMYCFGINILNDVSPLLAAVFTKSMRLNSWGWTFPVSYQGKTSRWNCRKNEKAYIHDRRCSSFLNPTPLHLAAYSSSGSHLDSCLVIWSSPSDKELQLVQNTAP